MNRVWLAWLEQVGTSRCLNQAVVRCWMVEPLAVRLLNTVFCFCFGKVGYLPQIQTVGVFFYDFKKTGNVYFPGLMAVHGETSTID